MFVLIVDSMWYFVERNGRAVKKSKHLFAAQLACVGEVERGIPSEELKIVDNLGREYAKVGV